MDTKIIFRSVLSVKIKEYIRVQQYTSFLYEFYKKPNEYRLLKLFEILHRFTHPSHVLGRHGQMTKYRIKYNEHGDGFAFFIDCEKYVFSFYIDTDICITVEI